MSITNLLRHKRKVYNFSYVFCVYVFSVLLFMYRCIAGNILKTNTEVEPSWGSDMPGPVPSILDIL